MRPSAAIRFCLPLYLLFCAVPHLWRRVQSETPFADVLHSLVLNEVHGKGDENRRALALHECDMPVFHPCRGHGRNRREKSAVCVRQRHEEAVCTARFPVPRLSSFSGTAAHTPRLSGGLNHARRCFNIGPSRTSRLPETMPPPLLPLRWGTATPCARTCPIGAPRWTVPAFGPEHLHRFRRAESQGNIALPKPCGGEFDVLR